MAILQPSALPSAIPTNHNLGFIHIRTTYKTKIQVMTTEMHSQLCNANYNISSLHTSAYTNNISNVICRNVTSWSIKSVIAVNRCHIFYILHQIKILLQQLLHITFITEHIYHDAAIVAWRYYNQKFSTNIQCSNYTEIIYNYKDVMHNTQPFPDSFLLFLYCFCVHSNN